MRNSTSVCLFIASLLASGQAQTGERLVISILGTKSLGSSLAFIALCEKEGQLPTGTLAELSSTIRSSLASQAWIDVKNQYQKSIHEKKQYSISRDKWYSFKVTPKDCQDIGKAIPMAISVIKRTAQDAKVHGSAK